MPTSRVVDVDGLPVTYGDVTAVRYLTSRVQQGELDALLGTNGAGKTSALDVIEGRRRATSGTVRVSSRDPLGVCSPDVTMPPVRTTPMSPGRVLAGRYTVGEVIGRGGMADVHVGHDTRTGRSVAIKALRSTSAGDPLLRSSLRREAQLLGRVRHHSIVALLDAGHDGDGDGGTSVGTHGGPYIVMEHVDGRSLRDLLRSGELTRETSVRYQLGLLAALEASHRAGIVHRDIKPANVMVTASGAVKLVDFGIARASGDPTVTVTHIQEFLGTPAYFSPEQARGETTDARSDLYSAGCLLFEMLMGRPPFVGDDPVLVACQHVHEPAPQAGTGVPAFDAVIAKALAKEREKRYQSAQAFCEALRSAWIHQPTHRTHDSQRSHTLGSITVGHENSTPVELYHRHGLSGS